MLRKKVGKISFLTSNWPLCNDISSIVLIHSSGLNAQMWENQITALSNDANVIAIDLPGHGASNSPGMNTIKEYAMTVAEFIKELRIPKPVPCGLSVGGGIVLQLLLDYSDIIVAGILMGTGARLRVAPLIFEEIENNYAGFPQFIGKYAFSPKTEKACIEKINKLMGFCPADVMAGDFRACNGFDVMNRLNEIKQPVLVVSGGYDRLTPIKYANYLEKEIRESIHVHIENAGHMMPNEQPQKVNSTIHSFLVTFCNKYESIK